MRRFRIAIATCFSWAMLTGVALADNAADPPGGGSGDPTELLTIMLTAGGTILFLFSLVGIAGSDINPGARRRYLKLAALGLLLAVMGLHWSWFQAQLPNMT